VNFFKLCFVGDLNSGDSNQQVLLKSGVLLAIFDI
jgi:hypothetical protein